MLIYCHPANQCTRNWYQTQKLVPRNVYQGNQRAMLIYYHPVNLCDKVQMYKEIMMMNTDNLESSLQTSIY